MDEAVEAYRALLEAAVEDLGAARSPAEFCEAERRVVSLTQQMAGALTQGALQQACDDPERVAEAVARIRERANRRGLQLRHERDRPTSVRTLSGEVVKVVTPYYTARPRSDWPLKKRGAQGTGVYPVLDQVGIAGRSTPAVRLLVARAVCEANSVASARDLLSAGGVKVGHKTALRLTYMVSDDALRTRKRRMATVQSGDDEGEFVGRGREPRKPVMAARGAGVRLGASRSTRRQPPPTRPSGRSWRVLVGAGRPRRAPPAS